MHNNFATFPVMMILFTQQTQNKCITHKSKPQTIKSTQIPIPIMYTVFTFFKTINVYRTDFENLNQLQTHFYDKRKQTFKKLFKLTTTHDSAVSLRLFSYGLFYC